MRDRLTEAHNEMMMELFGEVPKEPGTLQVDRDKYKESLHRVQNKYGLRQGDPDFLEWVLTALGRSPMLTSEGEIVYGERDDATTAEPPVG